jgi:hypothetical protein
MIKLNIEQQLDEIRDIENYIRQLEPLAVVELQSQQIRRLVYFSKKGIEYHRARRAQYNPALVEPISVTFDVKEDNNGIS